MRATALLVAATLVAYAVAEVVMEPNGAARGQFAVIFVSTAVLAGLVAWALPRWSRRSSALRRSIGVLAATIGKDVEVVELLLEHGATAPGLALNWTLCRRCVGGGI